MKWADEFNDQYEKGNSHSKWSAESQDKFEGSGMKKIVQEALERKVVWPWPKIGDEGSESMLKILKTNGYKEWKNPKEKKQRMKEIQTVYHSGLFCVSFVGTSSFINFCLAFGWKLVFYMHGKMTRQNSVFWTSCDYCVVVFNFF